MTECGPRRPAAPATTLVVRFVRGPKPNLLTGTTTEQLAPLRVKRGLR